MFEGVRNEKLRNIVLELGKMTFFKLFLMVLEVKCVEIQKKEEKRCNSYIVLQTYSHIYFLTIAVLKSQV